MSTTDLVFVTTTGRPGLSRANTKLMRGHVTRSNFAKRRRRVAERQRAEHELCHTEDRFEPPVLDTQKYSIVGEKFRKNSPSPKSRINTDDTVLACQWPTSGHTSFFTERRTPLPCKRDCGCSCSSQRRHSPRLLCPSVSGSGRPMQRIRRKL